MSKELEFTPQETSYINNEVGYYNERANVYAIRSYGCTELEYSNGPRYDVHVKGNTRVIRLKFGSSQEANTFFNKVMTSSHKYKGVVIDYTGHSVVSFEPLKDAELIIEDVSEEEAKKFVKFFREREMTLKRKGTTPRQTAKDKREAELARLARIDANINAQKSIIEAMTDGYVELRDPNLVEVRKTEGAQNGTDETGIRIPLRKGAIGEIKAILDDGQEGGETASEDGGTTAGV